MLPCVQVPSGRIPDRYRNLFHVSIHSRIFTWKVILDAWRTPDSTGPKCSIGTSVPVCSRPSISQR